MTKLGIASLLAVGISVLPGCVFVTDDDGPYRGTLTVLWSIDGQENPFDCIDLGADRLELLLYAEGSRLADELDAPCEAFGVSLDLPEGYYYGEATLVDGFDRAATVTEPLEDIAIIGGTDLEVSIDFPLGSFL